MVSGRWEVRGDSGNAGRAVEVGGWGSLCRDGDPWVGPQSVSRSLLPE